MLLFLMSRFAIILYKGKACPLLVRRLCKHVIMLTSAYVKSEITSDQNIAAQKMSRVDNEFPVQSMTFVTEQAKPTKSTSIGVTQKVLWPDATILWFSLAGTQVRTVTWNGSVVTIPSTTIFTYDVVVVGTAVLKCWANQLSTVFTHSPTITYILVLCPLVDTLAVLAHVLVCHLAAMPLSDKVSTGCRTTAGWVRTWHVRVWGPRVWVMVMMVIMVMVRFTRFA